MLSRTIIILLVLHRSSTVYSAADESKAFPGSEDLVRAGKRTILKLRDTPASWKVKCRLPNALILETKVARDADRQAWTFSEVVDGRSQPICRLFQLDGFWYAVGKDQALKSRPYEATLHLPGGYLLFSLADLRCVVDRSQFASATQEGRQGSILSYRIALPPENRRALEQMLSEVNSLGAKDPKFLERPDVADMLKLVRDQLAKGAPLRVDEATGIVVEFKLRDMLVTVEDFQWLDKASACRSVCPSERCCMG